MRLVECLENDGLSTEASVLWLNTMLSTLRMAENASIIPITQRVTFAEFLSGLADSRQTDADLGPSLAQILALTGTFYRVTRTLDRSRTAYEEALDIYRKLARTGTPTERGNFAKTLDNLGRLYFDPDLGFYDTLPAGEGAFATSFFGVRVPEPSSACYATAR